MVANPASARTGFTLTSAPSTIYETLSWRYDHDPQSQDRNHWIGQDKPVTYMGLLAADTIEDAVIKALDQKSAMAGSLLGDSGEAPRISELTKDEMCNLLLLNQSPEHRH